MKTGRLLRLGLRQFAAGMLSILGVGILNRVMKVELGLALGLVSAVISAHYFAAPLAIPFGHRSDRRPLFGLHRTPYILGGTVLTVAATAASPFVALRLAAQPASPLAIGLSVLTFLVLGIGVYTAGAAYLALIADLTTESERGKAVSVVWSMMMFGILTGVFLGVSILNDYTQDRLIMLFVVTAAAVAALTVVAVWGQETRGHVRPSAEAVSPAAAWRLLTSSRQTRWFFAFLFSAILFLFLQQVVLEPFGGDVFGLGVRQTTLFNAVQMVGVLGGMAVAGGWLSRAWGNQRTAGLGLGTACLSFALLGAAAALGRVAWVNPAIGLMGLGMGLFNVGGLALMMGMSAAGQTGMYMGAWTLAQALANGLASVGGGFLHDRALQVLGTEAYAYAVVFLVEAAGLLATAVMLRRVNVSEFKSQAVTLSGAAVEAT